MKNKIIKLSKSKFIRNIIILSSGTAMSQIINMIFSPIITRLYGPSAYGIMGAFSAIISIITPIAALAYPISVVLPKEKKEARALVHLSIIVTSILATISGLILFFFNEEIINLFNLETVSPYLFLIPIIVLSAGLLQTMEQILIRNKEFSVSAKATLLVSIITNGGKLILGQINPTASILVLFTSLRQGIRAVLMILFSKSVNLLNKNALVIDFKLVKNMAYKYKDFPIYRSPEIFFNSISGNLPILLLTTFFGPASAGFYSIGRTVLEIPSQLIGKSVGDVLYPQISETANNRQSIYKLIKKATLTLSIIGILPFGAVILLGPWLFGLVFGDDWIIAGEYARWLALWTYFGFINIPSVKSIPVLSAQRFQLFYTIFMLIVRVFVLFIGFYLFNSDIVAIALFSIFGAVLNVGLILFTFYLSKKFDSQRKESTMEV